MRIRPGSAAYVALALVFVSCSENGPTSPASTPAPSLATAAASPAVRISEFHYDNTGTDTQEQIEISGPAGMSLKGWTLVLYNGNSSSRAAYTTTSLGGLTIPATCGSRGVIVISYATNGIQNGGTSTTGTTDPDGFALVDSSRAPGSLVVEFLSYEGTFTAASGPAAGLLSVDVGVRELGTESASPVTSLKRNGSGVWSGPSANDFGVCNDNDGPPPADVAHVVVTPDDASTPVGSTQQFSASATDKDGGAVAATFSWSSTDTSIAKVDASGLASARRIGDVMIIARSPNGVADTSSLHVTDTPPPADLPVTRFSEIHYDNSGTDAGEMIEIEGPAGTDLTGWSVVLYNGNGGVVYNTSTLTGSIPATCGARGVLVIGYPSNGIQNGASPAGTTNPDPNADGMALVDASGHVVEFLSYEGVFTATSGPAAGMVSRDIGVAELGSDASGKSLQRKPNGSWEGPISASFRGCNIDGPLANPAITFTGRLSTEPALPVGFEDQLFASEKDGKGVTVPTTFTWTSETPAIASIDAHGVMHALSAGTAVFRATAADGSSGTFSQATAVATLSETAQYGNNTEFGVPTDWDESDDFIISRPQYTISFNRMRNTPNWVSYDLDVSQMVGEDRCDCFTYDPALPADFTHITTADYTGAGAFAGYGIDRGHLVRSFDRTKGSLDNAYTYYFSNIIPQAADLNQGPWKILEDSLGNLARYDDKEVYIVAGVAGNIGSVKGEGKIIIPEKVWKVAIVMPRDQGLADVRDYRDVEVFAVIMPNVAGIRYVDWTTYKTTVDAVEALSGYDLFSLLPDKIERAVESNTQPPFAKLDGPYSSAEGSAVAMSGAASFDPNGTVDNYTWNFGDGIESSGASLSHTYAQDGDYTVRLVVQDNDGLVDTTTSVVHVANVAPTVGAFDGATLLPGETYAADGSFTDPGSDSWTATADYGDGSGVTPISLDGKHFTLSHTYTAPGTYTVTVRVSDDDVTSSRSQTVTVLSPLQGVQTVSSAVGHLVKSGTITAGNANSLSAKLGAAQKQLERGVVAPVGGQLGAFLNELDAMVRSGRLSPADADPMRSMVQRVLTSLGA